MSEEITTDSTPVPSWLRGKTEIYDEPTIKPGKLPIPQIVPSGQKLICLQDPEETRFGRIIIPPDSRKRHAATVGTVVGLGDGYDPEEPPEAWQAWVQDCPYQIGTRVAWSRYEDTVIKAEVDDAWWDSPEERERERGKVQFIILHVKELIGVVA